MLGQRNGRIHQPPAASYFSQRFYAPTRFPESADQETYVQEQVLVRVFIDVQPQTMWHWRWWQMAYFKMHMQCNAAHTYTSITQLTNAN